MGTLLSLSKSAASTGLNWSEMFLLIFGLMVAFGVLGESSRSEKWKKWQRTFELFVIIGVAGEFFADGAIFIFSKHLQVISDGELTAASTKAENAENRADVTEHARIAMLEQLKPRDFSKKQMDDFVAAIKGKVTDLSVFTLADPEAAIYGNEVIDGLERAGVKVTWYPTTNTEVFMIPGISLLWDDIVRKPKGGYREGLVRRIYQGRAVFNRLVYTGTPQRPRPTRRNIAFQSPKSVLVYNAETTCLRGNPRIFETPWAASIQTSLEPEVT